MSVGNSLWRRASVISYPVAHVRYLLMLTADLPCILEVREREIQHKAQLVRPRDDADEILLRPVGVI